MLEFIECDTAIITLTAIHWDVGNVLQVYSAWDLSYPNLYTKIECSIRVASVLLEKLFFHTMQMLYID